MSEAPRRIQLSRKKGWRMPPNTVKVDRATGFGNPFPIVEGTSTGTDGVKPVWQVGTWEGPAMWFADTKEEAQAIAVKAYRAWIASPPQEKLRSRAVAMLKGKSLACWCKVGTACHADVLLELANRSIKCEAA